MVKKTNRPRLAPILALALLVAATVPPAFGAALREREQKQEQERKGPANPTTEHHPWPTLTPDIWRSMEPQDLAQYLGGEGAPGTRGVDARDGSGMTALMRAAQYSRNVAVIHELLAAGADIHSRDEGGWTALMRAAQSNGEPDVLRALIDAGADVNARNMAGFTALLWGAWRTPNPEILEVLLDAGAHTSARTQDGRSVGDLVAENPAVRDSPVARGLLGSHAPQ